METTVKGKESNSELTLTLVKEDFLKDMGSSMSGKVVKAFITKGE